MKTDREFNRLMYRAWLRDGDNIHTGESLLLACLLRAKGHGRDSDDMLEVRRILDDPNLDK